jgi:hypothetical protein
MPAHVAEPWPPLSAPSPAPTRHRADPPFSLTAPHTECFQKPPAGDLAPLLLVFLLRPLCVPLPPSTPTEHVRVVALRLTASPPGD